MGFPHSSCPDTSVGEAVGAAVGVAVGVTVGADVGVAVGEAVGADVGQPSPILSPAQQFNALKVAVVLSVAHDRTNRRG